MITATASGAVVRHASGTVAAKWSNAAAARWIDGSPGPDLDLRGNSQGRDKRPIGGLPRTDPRG
jgi:hypothetical protein